MQQVRLNKLGDDMLSHVMGVDPASRTQIAYLSTLREVCKDFKKAVDICSHNSKQVLSKKAADFRDDVRLHGLVKPPFSFNRGIERMLKTEDWNELLVGMREYNSDEQTQEIIIARLLHVMTLDTMHDTPDVDPALRKRNDASVNGVQGLVAWAMRTHPGNSRIQLDGCRISSITNHEPHQIAGLTAYILCTLTPIMHDNLKDVEIQRDCINTLRGILDEIPEFYMDLDNDVVDGMYIIDMSTLLQTGVYNIPTLVICAMREHIRDHELQFKASDLFHTLTLIMNSLTRVNCMQTFVMHEAEVVLLASMHHYSHDITPNASSVQENCIFALQELMDFDFGSMQHIQSVMQCTINTALQHQGNFFDIMLELFHNIMEKIDKFPVRKTSMQNFAASSGMVQIMLQHLVTSTSVDDVETGVAFEVVRSICEGNAHTTALMVAGDVARTIDSARTTNIQSRNWHVLRNNLLAILDSSSY